MLYLRLQAAAAKGAFDATVRVEKRLGTYLLRAGTLGTSDNAERHRFTATGGLREGLEDDNWHEPEEDKPPRTKSRGWLADSHGRLARRNWAVLSRSLLTLSNSAANGATTAEGMA